MDLRTHQIVEVGSARHTLAGDDNLVDIRTEGWAEGDFPRALLRHGDRSSRDVGLSIDQHAKDLITPTRDHDHGKVLPPPSERLFEMPFECLHQIVGCALLICSIGEVGGETHWNHDSDQRSLDHVLESARPGVQGQLEHGGKGLFRSRGWLGGACPHRVEHHSEENRARGRE